MYGGGNMICRYERTIFRSDNGFCIYVYSTADPSVPEAACKRKDSGGKRAHFTAVGHFLPETDLVDVDIQGQWKQSNYGLQFNSRWSISSSEFQPAEMASLPISHPAS